MTGNIVVGGLLGQGFVLGGFTPPGNAGTPIVSYADPRQATVVNSDNLPSGVDPRQATIVTS